MINYEPDIGDEDPRLSFDEELVCQSKYPCFPKCVYQRHNFYCIPSLKNHLREKTSQNERLITSRAAIAEEQVILRKELDEAQRHWDKTHRRVEQLEAENERLIELNESDNKLYLTCAKDNRAQIDRLQKERDEARDEIKGLKIENNVDVGNLKSVIVRASGLKQERDEARRTLCKYLSIYHYGDGSTDRQIAQFNGWDCFKNKGE